MSCTFAPATTAPSGSVTVPRTMMACAENAGKNTDNAINRPGLILFRVQDLNGRIAEGCNEAAARRTNLNMSRTPPFPPGNVVDVCIETGLLTDAIHAGLPLELPFPTPNDISGSPGQHSQHISDLNVEFRALCAYLSCGAVAESHRASRTFHCGTKVKCKQPA